MTKIFKAKGYKWIVLAMSFILMLAFSISLQALPPIFNKIMKDIPFSNSQAGMLMGAYAIPGIFLPFLVAYLARKINLKKLIVLALVIMIIGLIAFSLSKTFFALLICRLIAGIGATVLVVLAPLLVTIFFDQSNIGIAMGIFNMAVPFGTVLAANLLVIMVRIMEWRSIILGVAVFVGIVLAANLFLLFLPENEDTRNSGVSQKEPQRSFKMSLNLLLLALIWALVNTQLLAYITFGSQYYQATGISVSRAGLLTSFVMLVPIFLSPFVGIIIDKTGWEKQLVLIRSVIVGASFIFIAKFLLILPLWAVTLGIGFTPLPVFVFSLLPKIVEPHQVGMGLGVLTMASNIGRQ